MQEEWDSLRPPAVTPDRRTEILAELENIDRYAIRPMRAVMTGTATAEDEVIVAQLEWRAQVLREELEALQSESDTF